MLYVLSVFSIVKSLLTSIVKGLSINQPFQLSKKKYVLPFLVVLISLVSLIFTNIQFLPELFLVTKPYQVTSNERNVNKAIMLKQLTKSSATIGVAWAGSLPYFTGLKAIDFLGKSDKYIAQLLNSQ